MRCIAKVQGQTVKGQGYGVT